MLGAYISNFARRNIDDRSTLIISARSIYIHDFMITLGAPEIIGARGIHFLNYARSTIEYRCLDHTFLISLGARSNIDDRRSEHHKLLMPGAYTPNFAQRT